MDETATEEQGTKRTPRKLETREKEQRQQTWRPPQTLPTPDPQEGYVFKYVRISTLGNVDPSNISSKLRSGWVPCKAKDHPEIELGAIESSKFKDNVVIGGLMLCKAPVEMIRQRTDYYDTQTERQLQSVNHNLMREEDPRMPLSNESKSTVSFGKGT